ncbi:MAG: glutamate synthase subunit beta [Bacteroidales bacterium]|nr:glutamate synthase subunit beta [Bacteroidales bacterium]
MGNPNAFLTIPRQEAGHRPVFERISNFGEVEQVLNEGDRMLQASRCMDCGVPFCHWACPLGNRQPEWQDAACKGKWELAYKLLSQTNDFPEFTGRICPALCEKSCVLNHSMDAPVTVRENECSIIERAFREGYVHPRQYPRNGKKVAVVGAGPAGLSAAVQLNKRGYDVTVLEKMPSAGGLVRYGIPNFKLDKYVIDRRIAVLEQEGITFRYGVTVDTEHLPEGYDAYVISTGTPTARDLPIPGRELKGIYFALDLLTQQNRRLAGEQFSKEETVSAKGRTVLVIGGGDTGSDCIGTCHRQGCKNVTQIEIMPKPPEGYNPATPWPAWPMILRTSTSHEEGCDRRWSLSSCRFIDDCKGRVAGVEVEEVDWLPAPDGGRPQMKPTGRKSIIECDMVLLAMGFLKPQHPQFGPNVFLAGDAKTGTSLVVRALAGGRATAQEVDDYLNGRL